MAFMYYSRDNVYLKWRVQFLSFKLTLRRDLTFLDLSESGWSLARVSSWSFHFGSSASQASLWSNSTAGWRTCILSRYTWKDPYCFRCQQYSLNSNPILFYRGLSWIGWVWSSKESSSRGRLSLPTALDTFFSCSSSHCLWYE